MDITESELRHRYRTIENDELADLYRMGTLTDVACKTLEAEWKSRGLRIDALQSLEMAADRSFPQSLEGFGGWLIPPLIGLGITAAGISWSFVFEFFPLFADGIWTTLTTPKTGAYHPLWAITLLYEVIGNAFLIIASVYLLVLAYKRSKVFPRLMIVYFVVVPIFLGGDMYLAELLPDVSPGSESLEAFVRSIVGGLIWIPYFIVSKRVKHTFKF